METKYLLVVIGPTAIGKTALSIALANHFSCEILSCDSRQFYKEMTIGTAVPGESELAAAPHHFIQHKSIFENYTVGDFEKQAIPKIDLLHQSNRMAILVGGSGLYVNAVLHGLDVFPAIDPTIRDRITKAFNDFGIGYLQEQLQLLDPQYFDKLKLENPQTLENPQRLMRFLTVSIGAGKPYSSFLNQTKIERNFVPILIGLEANRNVLYNRINQRVDSMVMNGLLAEVKKVYEYRNLNALNTVGYKELFDYLDDKISFDEAISEIKKNTRHFAKRQLTWFKRNESVDWLDFETNKDEIISLIETKMI